MSDQQGDGLFARLKEKFGDRILSCEVSEVGLVQMDLAPEHIIGVCSELKGDPELGFEELIDVAGVDFSEYDCPGPWCLSRFAVVYQLLSISNNWRLRVRAFVDDGLPKIASVTSVWSAANWFEREAFDLFGIVFDEHPDLRRILTDYGFIGHPFRKDFPLNGYVEMVYDEEKGRVVYQPVTIENRISVPKVSRHDHRYVRPQQRDDADA